MRVKEEDVTVKISGPGETSADVFDNEDNTYDVEWEPKLPGKYTIAVEVAGKPINGSPFVLNLGGGAEDEGKETQPTKTEAPAKSSIASNSEASGKGLDGSRCLLNEVNLFTIYPKDSAGKSVIIKEDQLSVTIDGPVKPSIEIFDNEDGSFDIEYTTAKPGDYTITIKIDGEHVRKSPFKVNIGGGSTAARKQEAPVKLAGAKSEASGVGLKGYRIKVGGEPALFTVTPKDDNGKALKIDEKQLSITITGPVPVKAEIFDNTDGTFDVEWSPPKSGEYQISIKVNDNNIKESPFKLTIR